MGRKRTKTQPTDANEAQCPAIGAAFAAELRRLGYATQKAGAAALCSAGAAASQSHLSDIGRGAQDVPLQWLAAAAALGADMQAIFACAAPAIRPAAVGADAINASQIARILSAALPFLTVADIEAIIAIIRAARARAQGGQGGDGLTIV